MRTTSPLRYPGGKATLYGLMSRVLMMNRLERGHYVEPFAGGCGLALTLLYEGHVSDLHINDLDLSIWSFWYSVLHHTDELIEKIKATPVTIDEWHRQRATYLKPETSNPLDLGFSAFFLNRTNRSGIIKSGGLIGGLSQKGPYKLDCRFNRDDLARRVKRVSKYKNRIHLYRMDAIELIKKIAVTVSKQLFVYSDPPYYNKGSQLYANFYKPSDHKSLAEAMLALTCPWVVTYDNVQPISALYRDRRQYEFSIHYSLDRKRIGTEILIASDGLRLPQGVRKRQGP